MKCDFACEDEIQTLILSSAHNGDVRSLETYLLTVSNPNTYLNCVYSEPHGQKCTVLMIACLNGYKNMMQMLLNNFQPDLEVLNIVRVRNRDQQLETFEDVTVLWVGTALNNFKIVQLLVEHGAQVNHRIKTNSTPVRCACCNDNIDMVRYLVQNGADVRIAKIKHFTNLVASVFNGSLQMVAYLVDKLGCDVNECLGDGRSPLGAAVYDGTLEIVQFLLDRGARNLVAHYNQMSPLMLAAEKRRADLVNAIARHCSVVEQIEAEELLGSAFICLELGTSDFEQALGHLSRAMDLRAIHQLSKTVKESTHEVFNYRRESQTIEQLKELRSNADQMYTEALLIRERLLGPRNAKYRHSLRYRGVLMTNNGQYYPGLALWMYELGLHQQHSIDMDKEDLRQFISLFSRMISTSLPIPIENLRTVILVVMEELKHHPTSFDYNLYTLLFLISIASQVLLETSTSDLDRRVLNHLIYTINLHRYSTKACTSSLLHLSLNGRITADDCYFDRLFKYPCLRTTRVLLQCGADVNAKGFERCTPLHVFVIYWTKFDESILQLLHDAGAHFDYVNDSGETTIDVAATPVIQQLLRTKMNLNLKCLCARLIKKSKLSFHEKISNSLVGFVERH